MSVSDRSIEHLIRAIVDVTKSQNDKLEEIKAELKTLNSHMESIAASVHAIANR